MNSFIDPNEEYFKIAIASDLHAYDQTLVKDSAPSHLKIDLPEDEPEKHPISGLIKLIKENNLQADLLLCPGDLGHQAMPSGIQYAWKSLQKIKVALKAKFFAATSGNHDLDSRYKYNGFDAKGVLQSLIPKYPLLKENLNDKYWSKNFAKHIGSNFKIIVLNSSAYHGSKPEEINHGRISENTIVQLELILKKEKPKPINILMCHHHPQQHMEINLGEYDVMQGGQLILDLIGTGKYGDWLVIHGHKHHPKITYASGTNNAPIILSAGSLCAVLFKELQTKARNQFHIIYIPISKLPDLGLVGRIKSWDWASGSGWEDTANLKSGLPFECGFGDRTKPTLLAKQINDVLEDTWIYWDDLRKKLPHLDFQMPKDIVTLKSVLEKDYNLDITEKNGLPYQLGKKT